MADIPDRVRIGPHQIEIRHDPDTAARLREEGARGDSRADSLLVRLDPQTPHTALADTLLHELLHVMFHQTPLRTLDGVYEYEEAIVTALSPLLLAALRDNPHLCTYLTS